MSIIKERISEKTFENFLKIKQSHSKVQKIVHNSITMQKYLKPNQTDITKDEAQLIFKLRCQVTNIKVNLKGMYDDLACTACEKEEENQKHIIECQELNENENLEELKYEYILSGTVKEQLRIARKFKLNFKILENLKKET